MIAARANHNSSSKTDMAFLTIFVTAIITSAATQGAIWLKDRWTLARESKFSVLYAALFFEQYAGECSHRLGEIEAHIASGGHAGTDYGSLPDLPTFPHEIEWKRVGIRLTEDAFAFRVAVEAMNSKISYLYDFDPPDGGDAEVRAQLIGLGLRALELAGSLRQSAKLNSAHAPDPEYTTARHLESRKQHHEEVMAKYLASQTASHATLTASAVQLPV